MSGSDPASTSASESDPDSASEGGSASGDSRKRDPGAARTDWGVDPDTSILGWIVSAIAWLLGLGFLGVGLLGVGVAPARAFVYLAIGALVLPATRRELRELARIWVGE